MPETLDIPACLFPTACPNCGYSREGLPVDALCPECGRAYHPSEVILYGYARGRHENLANAKRSRIAWVILGPLAIFWLNGLQFMISTGWRSLIYRPGFLVIVACVFLPQIYFISRRFSGDHPGLIQVRLGNKGCAQFDTLSPPSELRKFYLSYCWLLLPILAIALFIEQKRMPFHSVQFWIFAAILSLIGVRSWIYCRRIRSALRKIPEGALTDACAAFYRSTRWNRTQKIQLLPVDGDHYLLRIRAGNWVHRRYVVDSQIQCTDEQADEIRRLIAHWRGETQPANADRATPAPQS
jgi:hypothetical protein